MDRGLIRRAAEDILKARRAVAFTGAGISVESGIPDFRSPGGLWSRFDPDEYAHIEAFRRDPEKVWRMLREMLELTLGAKPNPAHRALAELEELGLLRAVITQNVDGLHQRVGAERSSSSTAPRTGSYAWGAVGGGPLKGSHQRRYPPVAPIAT